MISIQDYYKIYRDSIPIHNPDKNTMNYCLIANMLDNGNYVFNYNIYGRYHMYLFNMLKPEIYAINIFDEKQYIPLSKDEVDKLIDGLINRNLWKEIIDMYRWYIETPENLDINDNQIYTLDSLNKISDTPPDYKLIWENGYTGNEDKLGHDYISYMYY